MALVRISMAFCFVLLFIGIYVCCLSAQYTVTGIVVIVYAVFGLIATDTYRVNTLLSVHRAEQDARLALLPPILPEEQSAWVTHVQAMEIARELNSK